jgi:hypothetical protein
LNSSVRNWTYRASEKSGYPLAYVDVPVVDSGAAQDVYARVAEVPCLAKASVLKLRKERALILGQAGAADDVDAGAFRRTRDIG